MYHYNFIWFIDSSEDEAHDDLSNLVEERFSVFEEVTCKLTQESHVYAMQEFF